MSERRVERVYVKLGKHIAKRRTELGMSQEDLANKIRMSRPAVINMEAGRQRIMLHRVFIIEKALGYPPGYMIAKGVR